MCFPGMGWWVRWWRDKIVAAGNLSSHFHSFAFAFAFPFPFPHSHSLCQWPPVFARFPTSTAVSLAAVCVNCCCFSCRMPHVSCLMPHASCYYCLASSNFVKFRCHNRKPFQSECLLQYVPQFFSHPPLMPPQSGNEVFVSPCTKRNLEEIENNLILTIVKISSFTY